MFTRSKIKLLNKAVLENSDSMSEKIKNYAKSINTLKMQLENEKSLNETLLNEQEMNVKDFEKLLTENRTLKKKLYESEEEVSTMNDHIKVLMDSNKLLQKEYDELENMLEIKQRVQIEFKLEQLQNEYDELQIKYCDLLSQTDLTVNRFVTVTVRKVKTKRYRKRLLTTIKKLTWRSARLKVAQNLMETELSRRNILITELQDQCDRFLEIIQKYEVDLEQESRIQAKINFLETKLIQLDCYLRKSEQNTMSATDTELNNTVVRKNDVIRLADSDSACISHCNKILMFSDGYAKNLGIKIYNKLKTNEKFINLCMPNASLETILNAFDNETVKLAKYDSVILLIGDYNKLTAKDYDSYPEILQKRLKLHNKFKLVLCSMRYDGKNDNQIYKINKRLHHLAVVNGWINYLDINTHLENRLKEVTKTASLAAKINYSLQNYQNTSTLHFISCNENIEKIDEARKGFQRLGMSKGLT